MELNIPGGNGVTAFKSDCVKEALEESGQLGEQTSDGIWEPENARIDVVKGQVTFSSNILGNALEPFDLKTPFVNLDEIVNDQTTYDCEVTTLGQNAERSLRKLYEAARPQLEKVYPSLKQIGRILGTLLDIVEQRLESKLTPTP